MIKKSLERNFYLLIKLHAETLSKYTHTHSHNYTRLHSRKYEI